MDQIGGMHACMDGEELELTVRELSFAFAFSINPVAVVGVILGVVLWVPVEVGLGAETVAEAAVAVADVELAAQAEDASVALWIWEVMVSLWESGVIWG
jgi:hypothetical protein